MSIAKTVLAENWKSTILNSSRYPGKTIKVMEYPGDKDVRFIYANALSEAKTGPVPTKLVEVCRANGIPCTLYEADDQHGLGPQQIVENMSYEQRLHNLADVVEYSHTSTKKLILGGRSLGGQDVHILSSQRMCDRLGRPDISKMGMGLLTMAPAIAGLRLGFEATLQSLSKGNEMEKNMAQMITQNMFVRLGNIPIKKSTMESEHEFELSLIENEPLDLQCHYSTILAGGRDSTVPQEIPVKLFSNMQPQHGPNLVVRDFITHDFSSLAELREVERELLSLVAKIEEEDLPAHERLSNKWICHRNNTHDLTLQFKQNGALRHSITQALEYENNYFN